MDIVLLYLIPIVTALVSCIIPKSAWIGKIQVISNAILLGIIWNIVLAIHYQGTRLFWNNCLYLDALSALMILLIGLIAFLSALYSMTYMLNEHKKKSSSLWKLKVYYILFNFFVLSMLCMVTVNSMGGYWIAIEASTIFSTFLVGYYTEKTTLEAAWKYIILCTVGISFSLIGLILIYYAVKQANGNIEHGLNFDYLLSIANTINPNLIKVSFVFIFIGFGTKAGLAPMHTWLPDAHSEAPTPISAFLSGVLLKCAVYGLIRYSIIAQSLLDVSFVQNFFIFFGLLSFAIAVPLILVQNNIKRLLAYSSLEHIGIIVTGLGFGTPLAVFGSLFHMFNHALVKTLLFFTAGNLSQKYTSKEIHQIRDVFHLMPITGFLLILGGLALAGMPPFSIFLSEFYILVGGIQGRHWLESVLFIIFLGIVFAGLTVHLLKMVMGHGSKYPSGDVVVVRGEVDRLNIIASIIPFFLILLMAWYLPLILTDLLRSAVEIITGGVLS